MPHGADFNYTYYTLPTIKLNCLVYTQPFIYFDKVVGKDALSSVQNTLPPSSADLHDAMNNVTDFECQLVVLLCRIVVHHNSFGR